MKLPTPRGPLTTELASVLRQPAGADTAILADVVSRAVVAESDPLFDEDIQLGLFIIYELSYRGFDEVDAAWEWEPSLLVQRRKLEERFETRLREAAGSAPEVEPRAEAVAERLFELAADDSGPSVSKYVQRHATLEQAREFLIHKSVYQLKEADPHTWAIPRLEGRAKAAMVEIQADEYGGGQLGRMHSELFATTMHGAGLENTFGAYIEQVPAITLASVNMMSLFGMHRRLRGAITGHLAIYEMTSSLPNAAYARGFRRLGFEAPVTDYFDEHVEADAVHEQIAGRDLAGGLVEDQPDLAPDVFFGAQAAAAVDAMVGRWQLDAWESGNSSLREPAGVAA